MVGGGGGGGGRHVLDLGGLEHDGAGRHQSLPHHNLGKNRVNNFTYRSVPLCTFQFFLDY